MTAAAAILVVSCCIYVVLVSAVGSSSPAEYSTSSLASAKVVASPSQFDSTSVVTVTWAGIPTARVSELDWIGAFVLPFIVDDADGNGGRCGLGSDSTGSAIPDIKLYVQWRFANISSTYGDGYGEISFSSSLTVRACYTFAYFFGDRAHNNYTLAAVSNRLVPNLLIASSSPQQVHLALGDDPSSLAVVFSTNSWYAPGVKAAVYYGLAPDALNQVVVGSSTTYTNESMCLAPANVMDDVWFVPPGVIHTVIITGLKPLTRYYYVVGGSNSQSGPMYSFVSPPVASSSSFSPFTVLAFGDVGVGQIGAPGSTQTISSMTRYMASAATSDAPVTLALHVGDVSYAVGYALEWDCFFALIEPIASAIPYHINIGNHEYDYVTDDGDGGDHDPSGAGDPYSPKWGNYGNDSGGECGVPLFYRFRMPNGTAATESLPQSRPSNSVFWYGADYGILHVVMISTEHNLTRGSEQHTWLESHLRNLNRSVTPWVILSGHRALYTAAHYDDERRIGEHIRAEVEPLMLTYRVDVALWGHLHFYERTCRMANHSCVPQQEEYAIDDDGSEEWGVLHTTIGMSGAYSAPVAFDSSAKWSRYHRTGTYGFTTLTVHNVSALTLQFFSNDDITTPLDQYTVRRR